MLTFPCCCVCVLCCVCSYQIVLYVAVLIVYIGPSALAGLAAMAFVIPFQGMVMMKLGKYRRKSARFTDTRVKTENEALATIRCVRRGVCSINTACVCGFQHPGV